MEINKQPVNINITSATILKTIAIFILLYFLYLVSDLLILFFVALVFSSALEPWVDWLKKRKIPRSVSVLVLYAVVLAVLGLILYLTIPVVIREVNDMSNNFPRYFESAYAKVSLLKDYSLKYGFLDKFRGSLDVASNYLTTAASNLFFTLTNIFGGIFSLVLVLVLTFYLVVEEGAIKKLVWLIAPARHQPYLMHLITRMQTKMGHWLNGQLVLGLAMVIMTYLGLAILGINYALILAIMVGLFSFIPYMGAALGAIPGTFIAFTQAPLLAVFALILFYIIHFIEVNMLYPKIMEKAVGLNPIVSILVLLAGFKLAGVIGAVLSIPVTTAAAVFIKDIFESRDDEKAAAEKV